MRIHSPCWECKDKYLACQQPSKCVIDPRQAESRFAMYRHKVEAQKKAKLVALGRGTEWLDYKHSIQKRFE